MILTRRALLERIASGHIIADKSLVQENSVNVRLGRELWTPNTHRPNTHGIISKTRTPAPVFLHAPREFDEEPPLMACELPDYFPGAAWSQWLRDVPPTQLFHVFEPGVHYIGTTADPIGTALLGDGLAFVPEMRARSTTGRHGLTVALCAGVGDVGYRGRWALEIKNNGPSAAIVGVGTEIGQVVFHTATEAFPEDAYDGADRYQDGDKVRFLPKPFALPDWEFE